MVVLKKIGLKVFDAPKVGSKVGSKPGSQSSVLRSIAFRVH